MPTTLLHVSDSFVFASDGGDAIDLGGLRQVVQRAIHRDVDAVVHTGNLFRSPEPKPEAVNAVRRHLAELEDAGIPFFLVAGDRETTGNGEALERLRDGGGARELSTAPTRIGDVALYGVDHVDGEDALQDRLAALEPAEDYTYNVVALHQRIWPPLPESDADISAFDAMEATDVFVDEVLAGGADEPGVWTDEKFGYTVGYAGSTNPEQREDVPTATLVHADTDEPDRERVPLTDAAVGDEVEQLRTALDFQPSDLASADLETLADLYGLAARAADLFDERRREARDELLDRVHEDRRIDGRYASVTRTTAKRRVPKPEREVFRTLRRAGIHPSEVLELDSSELRELSEEGRVADEDVFDREERTYVRVSETEV